MTKGAASPNEGLLAICGQRLQRSERGGASRQHGSQLGSLFAGVELGLGRMTVDPTRRSARCVDGCGQC